MTKPTEQDMALAEYEQSKERIIDAANVALSEHTAALTARIAELEKAQEWQPIETLNEVFSIVTDGTLEGTDVFKYKGALPEGKTHWIPLPKLPTQQEDK